MEDECSKMTNGMDVDKVIISDGREGETPKSDQVVYSTERNEFTKRSIFSRIGLQFHCLMYNEFNSNAQSMERHLKRKHFEKVIICVVCGADFREMRCLQQHTCLLSNPLLELRKLRHRLKITEKSNEQKKFTCDICKTSFKTYAYIKKHMYTVHFPKSENGTSQTYVCRMCQREFSNKYVVINHEYTHLKKPYCCTICHFSFTTAENLETHNQILHTPNLKVETKVEKKEETKKQYVCNDCNKGFLNIKSFKQHVS